MPEGFLIETTAGRIIAALSFAIALFVSIDDETLLCVSFTITGEPVFESAFFVVVLRCFLFAVS